MDWKSVMPFENLSQHAEKAGKSGRGLSLGGFCGIFSETACEPKFWLPSQPILRQL
jgi:hypothetical protein